MARLINLDDAVDAMKKSICGDTYEVDKAIEAIESIPTVEAIPIDFIEKKIDEYREKEDRIKDEPLAGYFEWVRTIEKRSLEWLLLDWKAEPEEQNERTKN
jgi:hypothetical protein